jgi:homoserine dehydrogenase
MNQDRKIGIGIIGLGVIGGQVAQALSNNERIKRLSAQIGIPIELLQVADIDLGRLESLGLPKHLLTTNASDVLNNSQVDVVVELIGGVKPAIEFISTALSQGKHVVTANKELMAKHGPELIELAEKHKVQLMYEASVGGGIPIIRPLKKDLLANDITHISAIINGTTNYIVTKMSQEGVDFNIALQEAQDSGFAESDPTADIDGFDPAYKLVIMASLAFHTRVSLKDVYREGIRGLTSQDFKYAEELGYVIKLLAIAHYDDTLSLRVHPTLIPTNNRLAKTDGVFNAIEIEGDLVGPVLFHGQGAGPLATSSAVIGDVLDIASEMILEEVSVKAANFSRIVEVSLMEDLITSYYARLIVADRPGVLASITTILGELGISIASIIQKSADSSAKSAEIVITTHPAKEKAVQKAFNKMRQIEVVKEIGSLIRIEN